MKQPRRRCVGCREMKDKVSLVRIVRDGGEIFVDTTMKASGRGAYLCRSADCLQKAHKTKGFERSFKSAVPPEIFLKLNEVIGR